MGKKRAPKDPTGIKPLSEKLSKVVPPGHSRRKPAVKPDKPVKRPAAEEPSLPDTSTRPIAKNNGDIAVLHRREVLSLLRRGWTVPEIAERMGLSAITVRDCWEVMKRLLFQDMLTDLKAILAIKLEEIGEIKREAWDAWERSKQDAMKTTEEVRSYGETEATKTTESRTGQCGDARYLALVFQCVDKECQLFNLFPALKVTMDDKPVLSWAMLAGRLPPGAIPDELEHRLATEMGYIDAPKKILARPGSGS